jgi:hypothetical protein
VVQASVGGQVAIPAPDAGRLTRLNYFDGKFLRAEDLRREQEYHRTNVALSNQAGGAGVVHGFDASLAGGDLLRLSPGLAIDPDGRVLHMPGTLEVSLGELIELSRERFGWSGDGGENGNGGGQFAECETVLAAPPGKATEGLTLYLITLSHVEALCGHEDVYGRLCEDACATSSDRPYQVEGVLVRAEPLTLLTRLAFSTSVALGSQHLRSQVASAYFADERARRASLVSGAGLRSEAWCHAAAFDVTAPVAVALVARAGATTVFVDPWAGRRERIDVPPRRYWAWNMSMRPWEVYLAQILQFQCQLRDLLGTGVTPGPIGDPCAPHLQLLEDTWQALHHARESFGEGQGKAVAGVNALGPPDVSALLPDLEQRIREALDEFGNQAPGRMLLNGGIVELPPAGYLPVDPVSHVPLPDQVRRLVGEGLDLRFCAVRHDYVAHAVEEAQHMDRISLLEGLDDPAHKPRVDVLVPDGQVEASATAPGIPFRSTVTLVPKVLGALHGIGSLGTLGAGAMRLGQRQGSASRIAVKLWGAAHGDENDTGGGSFCCAGLAQPPAGLDMGPVVDFVGRIGDTRGVGHIQSVLKGEEEDPDAATEPEAGAAEAAGAAARAFMAARGQFERFDLADYKLDPKLAGWLETSCDRSPFGLGSDETSKLGLRLRFAVPSGSGVRFMEVDAKATLEIEDAQAGSVAGRLRGTAVNSLLESDQDIDARVELSLSERSGGQELQVLIKGGAVDLLVEARWGARPLELSVALMAHGGQVKKKLRVAGQPLVGAQFIEDPAVLDPQNGSHVIASSAIEIIAAASGEQAFVDEAAGRLFPASRTKDRVTGPLDWVMFHRRRDIDCGDKAPLPAPVQPPVVPDKETVTYKLFHAHVEDLAEIPGLCKLLREGHLNAFIFKHGGGEVGEVEFLAGKPALVTPTAEIVSALLIGGAGSELGCLRIVATDPEDVEQGEGRLAELDDNLGDAFPHSDSYRVGSAMDEVPTELADQGIERAVFVVTTGTKTCVEVLCAPTWLDDALIDVIVNHDVSRLTALHDAGKIWLGGEPSAKLADTITPLADSNLPTEIGSCFHVSQTGEVVSPDDARLAAIVEALDATWSFDQVESLQLESPDWPLDCDAAVIFTLIGEPPG